VLGIATDLGSRTSHAAILARSLNIPAVVGLHDITTKLETGRHVLVDGSDGLLVVDPAPETNRALCRDGIKESQSYGTTERTAHDKIDHARWSSHCALGKYRNSGKTLRPSQPIGAEGIGLYRTEFLYLNRNTLPTEHEQFETYRKVAERVPARSADYPNI